MDSLDWLLARLNEPSTWRGIVLVLTSSGLVLSPELSSQIIALGLSAAGLLEIIRKERGK